MKLAKRATELTETLRKNPSLQVLKNVLLGESSSILPKEMVHYFGLECAQHCVAQYQERGLTVDPRSLEAIETKRDWLLGKSSNKELRKSHKEAHKALKKSSLGLGPYFATVCAYEVSRTFSPYYTAYSIAESAVYAISASSGKERSYLRDLEIQRQCWELADLIETYATKQLTEV